MDPDRMRWIDRWIGIPVCLIASVVSALLSVLTKRRNRATSFDCQRIAFVSLAEIGALVLAQPAISYARRQFPGVDVFFITFPQGVEMLRIMGFDDHHIIVIEAESTRAFLRSLPGTIRRLRALKLDTMINLEIFARFSAVLCWLTGAPNRVGFHPFNNEGGYVGSLFTRRLNYSPHHHIARSYLALVHALSEPCSAEPASKIQVDELPLATLRCESDSTLADGVRGKLQELLHRPVDGLRLVILNTNTSDLVAVRRWPTDNYVALARRLLKEPDVAVVLTGSPAEAGKVEELLARIGDKRSVSMAGQTTLRELIELFHLADAMVTNDSGPAHFASVTDLPTVVLFGPETPAIFGPLGARQQTLYRALACSPCVSPHNQKKSPCVTNLCMSGIDVGLVHTTLMSALDGAGT